MAIFGKNKPPSGDDRSSQPPQGGVFAGRPEAGGRGEARQAVIGPQIRIQGELSGDEDVVIEGKVEGKIAMTKTVRIGPTAQVNAEVRAQTIIVAGRVVGNLAAERVEIVASGYVEGNIRAPKIVISEGAQFKGSVDMGGAKPGAPDGAKGSQNPSAAKPA